MRKLTLLLAAFCLCSTLQAAGFFTLSEVKPTHVFVKNSSDLITKEEVEEVRAILFDVLKQLKLEPNQRDTGTLIVKIDSLSAQGKNYIHIKFAVGEDIITNRKGKVRSFALTYDASDFIQSEDPKNDIVDSVQYLADEFVDRYKDDNE